MLMGEIDFTCWAEVSCHLMWLGLKQEDMGKVELKQMTNISGNMFHLLFGPYGSLFLDLIS